MDLGFLQFKSMANLCTKIEIYLGRTPDFQNEVQVFFDNGKYSINLWNCKDKPEPKESDLCSDEEADYFESMRFLREKRDDILDKTEWTVNNDNALTEDKKKEWITYRKKLRDITTDLKTSEDVEKVTMPTEPEK